MPSTTVLNFVFFALAIGVRARGEPGADLRGPLSLPIFPVPIVREKVPLTKALSEIGARVTDGYALFGIEVRVKDGQEPVVNLHVEPPSTLQDALRQVFSQLPDYGFRVVSDHIVNVYPLAAKEDPNDVLNVRVTQLDIVDEQPSAVLTRPQDFIPELKDRLIPKALRWPLTTSPEMLVDRGPTVSIHLKNATVRQILNAVSEATEQFPATSSPLGWAYSFQLDPQLPAGGKHLWSFHWSAPRHWKDERDGTGVPRP